MVLRSGVIGTACSSRSPTMVGAGAGVLGAWRAARSTSSLRILPPGPVPSTREGETPSSAEARRAAGPMGASPAGAAAGAGTAGCAAGTGAGAAAGAASPVGFSASSITPITTSMATDSPSPFTISRR